MGKNAIVGQSGGPTSVINASLAGVFESCKSRGADVVYGMCNGVAGLLEERVVDLSTLLTDDLDIELLKRTPSSFLGSCRYKLPDWHTDEAVYKKLFAILEKLNIGYFFYIGGNDSMDTIGKLADYGAVAFGCPAMGAEQLEEGEFEPMFADLEGSLSGVKAALFGSYGWGSGQWLEDWCARCKEDGAVMQEEPGVMANEAPDDDAIAACNALGAKLAVC